MVANVLRCYRHRGPLLKASNDDRETYPPECRIIGIRHLCGTEPRSRHLSNAFFDTPSSRAIFRNNFQSGPVVVSMGATLSPKTGDAQPSFIREKNSLFWLRLVAMGSDNDVAKARNSAIRKRVSDSLRAWRLSRGDTQAQAASMLGVAEKTYQKWEQNERGMPLHRLSQFCLISGVEPNWLLLGRSKGKKEEPTKNPSLKKPA